MLFSIGCSIVSIVFMEDILMYSSWFLALCQHKEQVGSLFGGGPLFVPLKSSWAAPPSLSSIGEVFWFWFFVFRLFQSRS